MWYLVGGLIIYLVLDDRLPLYLELADWFKAPGTKGGAEPTSSVDSTR